MAEPGNGLVGRFSCDVLAPGTALTTLPGADILGSVEGKRWSLPVGAMCQYDEKKGRFSIRSLSGTGASMLVVSMPLSAALSINPIGIGSAHGEPSVPFAVLYGDDLDALEASSIGGFVQLYGVPVIGQRLSGYVEIAMIRASSSAVNMGAPCSQGLAQCGWDASLGVLCMDLLNGPMCSVSCSKNADCPSGSVCSQQYCAKPCFNHQDCPAPLRCTIDDPWPSACF
jgi:hypothetical protein